MDNYSAYAFVIEALKEENSIMFNTIEVLFLLPNTTSRY